MRKILLDTDIGTDVDDAFALGLALSLPELEILAITTVSADTLFRGRIARKLLKLAGRSEIPVFAGEAKPVDDDARFFWHGGEGDGILEEGDEASLPSEGGVAALGRLLRAHDDVEIVAIGPMTNLARLIERDPDVVPRIAQLTIMGGHLREIRFGEKSFPFGIDYNIVSDPRASEIVLAADIPTRLVTADVTLRTWLPLAGRDQLASSPSPLREAIVRALDNWTPVQRSLFEQYVGDLSQNAAFLHDPLALACIVDESFCTFAELPVRTQWVDGVFRTIEDSSTGRLMRCAIDVDGPQFAEWFVARLLSL